MNRTAEWVGRRVRLEPGDITRIAVDVIVNAANAALVGGGGVDGAIHAAAGPSVMEELRRRHPDGTPTGTAVVTHAGRLPARWIVHAVGPVWTGGGHGEARLLASAYRSSLDRAEEVRAQSIAFAAISCGIYSYPLDEASDVATRAAHGWLTEHSDSTVRELVFVLRGTNVMAAFERALARLDLPSG